MNRESGEHPRPRRSRRVDAPGTGPAEADHAEPRLDPEATDAAPPRKPAERPMQTLGALSERDRWLLEQRPPHWG
ncbi:hypothetical protein [Citricoccus muralis]|uniref:Uncharacterized protein n=1 Tax=Citricoccus muralis TaxID=169134 RepID=A0ABY8H3S7_9MICC|nr:hypothetical protein [Citricoccus muralis]WFP15784.1 hypothetical protein P8192_10290 [Citricoccus muralis]